MVAYLLTKPNMMRAKLTTLRTGEIETFSSTSSTALPPSWTQHYMWHTMIFLFVEEVKNRNCVCLFRHCLL